MKPVFALLACAVLAGQGTAWSATPAPCAAFANVERPWLDATQSAECRADALLATLKSVDDKLAALGGNLQDFGIVDSGFSDGPAGPTRAPAPPASPPNPLTIAASFDTQLAAQYGEMIGREFRAAGMRRMWGPTVDVARTWQFGRVPEAYGEDPLLSSQIAAAVVRATQAQGVAVTLKHFVIYTQEQGRTGDLPFGLRPAVNNIVSERAIREIYLPPFRAAVQDGGALGVMCAFPRINGVYTCENPYLLGILKNEWGMRGTVSPDFPDAQRTVIEAVNAGLDSGNFGLERPRGPPPAGPPPGGPPTGGAGPGGPQPDANLGAALGMGGIPGGIDLKTAVLDGRVKQARLDDMIRRRLVSIFAVGGGMLSPPNPAGLASAAALTQSIRTAEQGATLLRNERGILPLDKSVKSIAVIGVQAGAAPQATTSGSAFIEAKQVTSALDAIKARAGAVQVGYAPGSLKLGSLPPVDGAVLRTPDGQPGLRAEYFGNPSLKFEGQSLRSTVDATINQRGHAPVEGLPKDNAWSVRWQGTLTPRATGRHTFTLGGAGSARLYLDDKLVARYDHVDFGTVAYASVILKSSQAVKLRVEYTPRESAPIPAMDIMGTTLGTKMQLGWTEPDTRIADAVALARKSDVALVFAADNHGEGADRSTLALPGDQNELIAAVAAANPRTVVILNTSGAVTMPWASKVGSILEMWYPGDALGQAASRLLFGDATPAGRLPITFPASEAQGPAVAARNYPGTVDANGALDEAHYDEGLLTGYRWFDAKNQKPLFPFGHGLSYSPISIDNVKLSQDAQSPRITATLRNAGVRTDSEVLQVYLGFPAGAGEPPKRLAAFSKVALPASGSRTVEIAIPPSAFEIWDETTDRWVVRDGSYTVMVGRSSRDIVFKAALQRGASAR